MWTHVVTIQSTFARDNAAIIASAASKGLITTRVSANVYGRVWRVTSKGLESIS